MKRAESIRAMHPLFQAGQGGSIPTSALCLRFGDVDFNTAKALARLWHSRFPSFGGGGFRACYGAGYAGLWYAVAIWTNPSSPKLPQREWLMLKRWAIADDAPRNTGSRMMMWMRCAIRRRFPGVTTLVTYSDPDAHNGTLYRVSGWEEGETTLRPGDGANRWRNRERQRSAANAECKRVTRWTVQLR